MHKPISTRTHGLIDYGYAAALIVMPVMFSWNPIPRRLAISAGLVTLGTSLMTNYEYGLVPVFSMRAHLALDAAESSMLIGAPARLAHEDRRAGQILLFLGVLGAAVGALTRTQSPREALPRPAWT